MSGPGSTPGAGGVRLAHPAESGGAQQLQTQSAGDLHVLASDGSSLLIVLVLGGSHELLVLIERGHAVTCGITFTFGGLRINADAQVLSGDMEVIPGLYAAGEIVGGIFYFNYPGGSGLTNGSVFGKIAGTAAAASPA